MEKERGIPVQMLNDRDTVSRPFSQVGFIEWVISPLAISLVQLLPQIDDLAENLACNVHNWAEIWVEQTHADDESANKIRARAQRVALKCQKVMRPCQAERLPSTV